MNRRLLTSVALGVAVLGVASGSFAQSVTLSSQSWSSISGATTFSGSPLFTIQYTGASSGAFGAATLNAGNSTTVTFSPLNLNFRINDSGGINYNSGTRTSNFSFATSTGSTTFTHSTLFDVLDLGAGTGSGADAGISSNAPSFFTTSRGGGQVDGFRFELVSTTSNLTDDFTFRGFGNMTGTLTYQGIVPEPATLALFGLGLAPVAVAIRRRRK